MSNSADRASQDSQSHSNHSAPILAMPPKAASSALKVISPAEGKITRKKNIDFSKLGQQITLSSSQCHKCKNVIQVK